MIRRFLASLGLALGLAAPALAAPQVAADIAPVQSLVARVMAGAGTPALIVPPGASPHGHAMRPSEAAALERAEVVFWIGEALTPWLEEPIDTLAGDAHVIELLGAGDSSVLGLREGITFAPEGEAHAEMHDHGHDHGHEGADSHAWLDPANARAWLAVIAAELGALDPENAALYAANAAEAAAELDALETRIAARLAPLQEAPYLVFHDAYQYFEARFGLRPVAALSPGDATDPGPARLAALRDLARETGLACVFSEPQFDGSRVTAIFGDTVRHGVLDPLGRAHAPGPALYPALLEDMAEALAECLTGRG
jgi:zinc transport system substrate-binding protein